MATKSPFKTTFEADEVIRPIFTGGSIALENSARVLATTLGEDAILTDLHTGRFITKVEGVRIPWVQAWEWLADYARLGWRIDLDVNP